MENNTKPTLNLSDKRQATIPETLLYAVYFIGQNLIYWLVTNFLMFFYTDYALISPGTVAVIFLIAKVWDAINDPIFGMIVDRNRSKKAKFTPWVKISSFLLPLSTILIFTIPSSLPNWGKIILAFLTYALWDILYTVSDVPIFALSTAMTDNVNERSNLVNFGRIGAAVGAIVINLVAPVMVENNGMLVTAIALCTAAAVTMLPIGFIAKERTVKKPTDEEEANNTENHGFKEMFTYLKGNKYLLYFYAAFIIHNTFKVTLGNYVAEHLLGGLGVLATVGMYAMPLMLLIYVILPFLTKRFDRMTIYKVSIVGSLIIGVIQYFVGYKNFNLYVIFSVIRATVEGFAGVLMFTFSGDAVEYGHYKTGMRKEGITFSLQTFSAKLTAALAGVITALLLALIGYEGGAVVTGSMATWIWAVSCFAPVIGAALSLPFLMKYDIKVKDVQIMSSINSGHITREEGDAMLSREY